MVENSNVAYKALLQNQTLLYNQTSLAENCQILQQDASHFLASNLQLSRQKFDIIFCDPPYNKGWLDKLLPVLNQYLTQNGVLYVEAEFAIKSDTIWHVKKQDKAGNVYYHLIELNNENI